jgi:hypothetical protein
MLMFNIPKRLYFCVNFEDMKKFCWNFLLKDLLEIGFLFEDFCNDRKKERFDELNK